MYAASVILLQTPCQGQLHAMRGFILYYRFQHYGFLWVSSALLHKLKRSIIDYLTKSAHPILFRMGQSSEVLAVFFYQQTPCQYYYGTIREYIRQEVQKTSRSQEY